MVFLFLSAIKGKYKTMQGKEIILDTLRDYLKKKLKNLLLAELMLYAICAFFILLGIFVPAENENFALYAKGFFMLAASIGAIALFINGWKERKKYNPNSCKLLKIIEEENQSKELVWIYPHHTQTTQYGRVVSESHALVFRTVDNEEYFIQLKDINHLKFLTMLQIAFPKVSYGFTEELRNQYLKNPQSLLKAD
ncbi:MAG: hypothetical protein R2772_00790 [Chitinophagales bacterium]